jgi:ATP-dependent helicase HrpA
MDEAAIIGELKRLLPLGLLRDQLRIGVPLARWLAGRRRGAIARAPLERWLAAAQDSMALRQERQENRPSLRYPGELPITARRQEIVEALRKHPVLVIAGETGSGKTTQLPKMCLEAGYGVRALVGCTQPRRVAALSLARRVAEELDRELGREVGCKFRFSDQTSAETYIKFMTDGILLAEAQADPFLSEYEVIIIDEAHERSLNIDFLLGLLRNLMKQRDDLKVIITSATIDTESFSKAFDNAPIIEVSGRMYPVDVIHAPPAEPGEEQEDTDYVDAAIRAVEDLATEPGLGDVLVFMPTERDILETCDCLKGRLGGAADLVPLFGRLSIDDQQRVFAPSPRRKIVVATNIAETSLTVPGIRYVVDTGLARISRYSPRTRTKRLPVEPVSQSSANQRKGRCGRVAEGVCIRLYDEADFQSRPPYTQPEIQRANLAEVILRMKAFHMGEIETFPFINPPAPQAIQSGYQLLQELAALDDRKELTELGRQLAHLPVDPTIGRMILQARHEGALPEVLIIAAGLSIQDPRERPIDKQEIAQAAQRKFLDPRSDFLSLLNIWNGYRDSMDSLKTQSQLRRFCKTHFLSYPRMREWRDIHAQLREAVADLGDITASSAPAGYDAIHRCILTGLWGHVAFKKERNFYTLAGNRIAMVFPGSALFERNESSRGKRGKEAPDKPVSEKTSQPRWTVSGEILETSRLFVRTVAEINPQWIVDLGGHVTRRTVRDPRWDALSGRVLATERLTLNGLEVLERSISYGQENPADATALFVRSALVENGILEHFKPRAGRSARAPIAHADAGEQAEFEAEGARDFSHLPGLLRFLEHNHQLRQKIEIWQTRLSQRVAADLEESFFQYYQQRLENVSSVADLNRVLREHITGNPEFLRMTPADLLGDKAAAFESGEYPDTLAVGERNVPLAYAYAPGRESDGVTVRLPAPLAQVIDPGLLDWVVPGLREPQILHLLQSLPKDLRRALMPLPPKAREMAQAVAPEGKAFLPALIAFIQDRYGVCVPADVWNIDLLPSHLRPRFEIVDKDQKTLASGRDLKTLRVQLELHDTTAETAAWRKAVGQWERYGLSDWSFGDLPEKIVVADIAGFPLHAHPGLQIEGGDLCLRLFQKPAEAEASHLAGVLRLAEMKLIRELGWIEKDLHVLKQLKPYLVTMGTSDDLEEAALENLKKHLLRPPSLAPRTAAAFAAFLENIRSQIPGLVNRFSGLAGEILKLRHEVLICRTPYPGMRQDLDSLLPQQFPRFIPFDHLAHVPRYLKAMMIRGQRASVNLIKDQEKATRIRPHVENLRAFLRSSSIPPAARAPLSELYWMTEEFKVSCFAQELGTAEPVSAQKLDQKTASIKGLMKG